MGGAKNAQFRSGSSRAVYGLTGGAPDHSRCLGPWWLAGRIIWQSTGSQMPNQPEQKLPNTGCSILTKLEPFVGAQEGCPG